MFQVRQKLFFTKISVDNKQRNPKTVVVFGKSRSDYIALSILKIPYFSDNT